MNNDVKNTQRRRHLLKIKKETRLSYVMMLVGSKRDPPLASRAIAAMLVDHWCEEESCSFLQKVLYAGEDNKLLRVAVGVVG